ncbi:unnamed protein product, partial [Tetraodon nigroviridis]
MGGAVVDDGPPGVKAPDGGWGWAVLAGCFVITGFSYAFPKAVSVFFKELIREFGVGYSDTAWISSILLAMLYGTGPLCSVLVNRFGCRPVMIIGGLFASAGMILASFATNIVHIYLAAGVTTALNFQPSLIMLNRYFIEKRPLANGLAAAVFVVNYAKSLGYEDTTSALLLTILGFVDMFARPAAGFIAGMKWARPRSVYLLCFAIIFNGCTDLIGSQAKNYPGLVVFCIFFGMSYGMVGALQFEVLMAIVGTEKFPSAIGLVLLVEAVAVLVGPPGAGRLLDATHQYMHIFLLAGCEVTLSAFVLTLGNFLCIKKKQ